MRSKRWRYILLALVLVSCAAKVLLLDIAASPGAPYVIELDALHRAARSGDGALPASIEVERVAEFWFPRSVVVAGAGLFRKHAMAVLSHRVVWPERSLIIDAACDAEAARALPGSEMHADSYARMARALTRADKIVFTHEHFDHLGGVASASDFAALSDHVVMTQEQFAGLRVERALFAEGSLERIKPLDYSGLHRVAPGVVLQKAPGHSGGSQLVYVELASGVRYLFVGDIAWSEDNLREQRGRPGLVTLLMLEDRAAVASEVRALGALSPDVHVVTSHDVAALERDLAAGLFKQGFSE